VPRRPSSEFVSCDVLSRKAGSGPDASRILTRAALFSGWSRAVGPKLRSIARPSGVSRGSLLVEVPAPAWIPALESLQVEIVRRLNEMAPGAGIDSLRFRVVPGAGVAAPPCRRESAATGDSWPAEPPDPTEPDAGSIPLGAIRDEALRRRYSAVVSRYLGRRRSERGTS
jgi:hypothetical protein